MAFRAKNLIGNSIQAVDREIGLVDDLYFDDERWTIRYLICNTGKWLSYRRILNKGACPIGVHSLRRYFSPRKHYRFIRLPSIIFAYYFGWECPLTAYQSIMPRR